MDSLARGRLRLFALIALGFLALAPTESRAQAGYDRAGGDYSRFHVPSGDPAICAARCDRESRCRAWTFSYPAAAQPVAICWLKSEVRPRVAHPCCVTGVRGSEVVAPRNERIEFGIDRPGGDFKSFDVSPDPTGAACAKACEDERQCRAWTYVRPGYIGGGARCFLKSKVRPPRRKPCCVSGVVR